MEDKLVRGKRELVKLKISSEFVCRCSVKVRELV